MIQGRRPSRAYAAESASFAPWRSALQCVNRSDDAPTGIANITAVTPEAATKIRRSLESAVLDSVAP